MTSLSAAEMDPARWREVRALFDEVVELAPAQRAGRLAAAGRRDPALQRSVELLLTSDAGADARLASMESALGLPGVDPPARLSRASDPLGLVGHTISHFRVIEPLASGGMGVVYRAEDTRLGRAIALKLPLPQQGLDAGARQRFLREGRAAGALDHPNVCAIHEVGESEDGQPFLAMALCPGETLRARLDRDGPVPVPEALEIARAIARGLGAAHAAGIVHRDVKPANVMLQPDGGVKVLDFGLAKVRDLGLSASRTIIGTVSYMAPEQLRGAAADARTDLWALGVVLYEMLSGRRPFDGDHDGAIAFAIVHHEPARPLALRAGVPRALEAVVLSLLQKDRERRPATAVEVESDLAAAGAGRAPRRRWKAGLGSRWARPARRSVRLLGLGILVVAAGAVATLTWRNEAPVPAPTPGTAPAAAALPTADAQAYDFYLRGRDYERRVRSRENLLSAQLLYVRALAIDPAFALARARLAITHAAMQQAAYDLSPSRGAQARAAAQAALRDQPALGEGHLALGHVWALERKADRALAEYELAVARMPESAEPHTAIALVLRDQGRWEEAVTRFERAATLEPRDVNLLQALARTQSRLRRYDAAVRTWDRVIELAPDDHDARLIRGVLYIRWHGITDTLAAVLRRLPPEWDPEGTATWARYNLARLERRPADALAAVSASRHDASYDNMFYRPRALLQAQAYAALGDVRRARATYETARAQLEDSVAAQPSAARMHVALGLAYAGLGQRPRAVAEARRAMALAPATTNTPVATAVMGDAAEILVRAGDVDGALALLERLLGMPAGRELSVALLRLDPIWDPLRGDERFAPMLARFAAR